MSQGEWATGPEKALEEAKRETARVCENPNCRKSFVPARSFQKFCTPRCRLASWRERKAQPPDPGTSAQLAAEQMRIRKGAGEWGALRRHGGGPRECCCNGSHVLYWDEDGDAVCHKCGGFMGGPTIFAYISRQKNAGHSCAEIAGQLKSWGVPLVLGGRFAAMRVWTPLAVAKVLIDGYYLDRARDQRQPNNIRTSSAIWISDGEVVMEQIAPEAAVRFKKGARS